MESTPSPMAVYSYALQLISRREYSQADLKRKLNRRFGEDACALIDSALERLATDNYQSDQRFTELFIRSRLQRGYGLNRIKLELRQKGIDQAGIINSVSERGVQEQEQEQLKRMWRKKFKSPPQNPQERYQQQHHLIKKGFRKEIIERFFNAAQWEDEQT